MLLTAYKDLHNVNVMGNKVTKEVDISAPSLTWDKENNRPKYFFPNGTFVFNFYGEYSRDEFLKANVDDPEFEKMVKKDVENYTTHYYIYRDCKSCAHNIYYKDQKYGFAWFNMAYIKPMFTIDISSHDDLSKLKIQRFLGDAHISIQSMHTNSTIKWSGTNADVAANYVCDIIEDLEVYTVKNDMGCQETTTTVTYKKELQCILMKLIDYMMSMNRFPN